MPNPSDNDTFVTWPEPAGGWTPTDSSSEGHDLSCLCSMCLERFDDQLSDLLKRQGWNQ